MPEITPSTAELAADLERARTVAVSLEQENARLHQVIGYLLTNHLERSGLIVPTCDIDAMAGRVELTDAGDGYASIVYRWRSEILAGGAS